MYLVAGQLARRCLAGSLTLCLALACVGPSVAIACEGASEEITTELEEGGGTIESSFRFPAGAPPMPPLDWTIENGNTTRELTLGVLTLGGPQASDYSKNNGCNNARLEPKRPGNRDECIEVIKLERETGRSAEVTGEGTYTGGARVRYRLNLSH